MHWSQKKGCFLLLGALAQCREPGRWALSKGEGAKVPWRSQLALWQFPLAAAPALTC